MHHGNSPMEHMLRSKIVRLIILTINPFATSLRRTGEYVPKDPGTRRGEGLLETNAYDTIASVNQTFGCRLPSKDWICCNPHGHRAWMGRSIKKTKQTAQALKHGTSMDYILSFGI